MMQEYRIEYTKEAADDLREIYAYIAYELLVPDTAEGQVGRIQDKVRSLGFMPEKYAPVEWEPWKSRKVHRVPVDNFLIFYVVDKERTAVTVIRILYSGRNIEELIQKGERKGADS